MELFIWGLSSSLGERESGTLEAAGSSPAGSTVTERQAVPSELLVTAEHSSSVQATVQSGGRQSMGTAWSCKPGLASSILVSSTMA